MTKASAANDLSNRTRTTTKTMVSTTSRMLSLGCAGCGRFRVPACAWPSGGRWGERNSSLGMLSNPHVKADSHDFWPAGAEASEFGNWPLLFTEGVAAEAVVNGAEECDEGTGMCSSAIRTP